MYISISLPVAASALLSLPAPVSAALYNTTIHTKNGDVVGYPAFNSIPTGNLTQWQDIAVWKGIPFAATTGGNNRWRAPQPVEPWNNTLYAKNFGPICPAAKTISVMKARDTSTDTVSEDCLSLNVWSAAKSPEAKLPVVMWSYPAESTASDALFDGSGMADKDIVFVNYNYRTGAFGWMSHPELSEEFAAATGYNSSGNYGMLDQFAALKWIRENIAAFGGDPEHITVMGQSAGSAASYHILNSPLTKGQIVGAIIESGVRDPHDPLCASLAENYLTLDASLAQGTSFLESLNISNIAQARALPYSDLVTTFHSTWGWTATLDHYAMPGTYLETLQKGAANQVPVLTGNTKDESGATYGLNISLATYEADLNSTYNDTWVQRFYDQYPADNASVAGAAENAQFSDRSAVGTYFWTKLWQQGSSQPVWNYFWDHAPPGQTQGAYHESEINYVLNNLYDTDLPWTSEDYEIARVMNEYWANFIKYGNPNGVGLVEWPAVGQKPMVHRVGEVFKHVPIATDAKVELFREWFATLPTY